MGDTIVIATPGIRGLPGDPSILTISSVAALRALIAPGINYVGTKGYYAPGDQGAAQFIYDQTDTSSADNGGSIIVDATGRRWKFPELDTVSVLQFGARGTGVDDVAALQSALDSGAKVVDFPARYGVAQTVYGVNSPLFVPKNITLRMPYAGSTSVPQVIVRARVGFDAGALQLNYLALPAVDGNPSVPGTYNVAAVLISKAFRDGGTFTSAIGGLTLENFCVDGGSAYNSATDINTPMYAARGESIHGMLLLGFLVRLGRCHALNTSGFGFWITDQSADGKIYGGVPGLDIQQCRTRNNCGAITNTYTVGQQTHFYAAYHFGSLLGARGLDSSTGLEVGSTYTDGKMFFCDQGLPCYGHAVSMDAAGGWQVGYNHINGPGADALYLNSLFSTIIQGNYLDGWGTMVPAAYGDCACINARTIKNFSNASILHNAMRFRPVANSAGNVFAWIRAVGAVEGVNRPALSIRGNTGVLRPDVTDISSLYGFKFSASGTGTAFDIQVEGNDINDFTAPFASSWNSVVNAFFKTNSFQRVTAKPAPGSWYPQGIGLDKVNPTSGGLTGWLKATAGTLADWDPQFSQSGAPHAVTAGATAPDVSDGTTFVTANVAPTTISGFANGSAGQTIAVFIGDAFTTIDFTGTTLKGNGGVDWAPAMNASMRGTFDGTNWHFITQSA